MGAKFSSGSGATVFYDDGPITAPSGEQGTQRTEFEAAIKSVTSATTVGAVFVYDTRNDSDPSWRKRCQGLSWFDETLNTATRGGRREFPSIALIVSDSVSGVTIYDLDDPSAPMWMVFNGLVADWATKMLWASGHAGGGGLVALNGRLILGRTWVDFASDEGGYYYTTTSVKYDGGIGDRNSTTYKLDANEPVIVNENVNDVAATVLEGAEIGALGLPKITIGIATDGGVSVIHPNGTVADDTYQITGNNKSSGIGFNSTGGYFYASNKPSTTYDFFINRHNLIYSDTSSAVGSEMYRAGATASGTPALSLLGGVSSRQQAWAATEDTYAIGSTSGLSLIKYNTGNPSEGSVCDVTSTYNTGYMLGDIRLALAVPYASSSHGYSNGNTIGDRSVKANNLTTVAASGQQVTAVPVATDAETFAFSNFSSSNYLERTDANLGTTMDFGTGDFSVVFWVKTSVASVASGESDDIENYIARMDNSLEAGDWVILKQADTTGVTLQFYRHSGSSWAKQNETAVGVMPANTWTQVVFSKKGNDYQFYINGKKSGNKTSNPNSYSSNSSFTIGHALGNSGPADSSSLSLVRISATAPTPQQVKDIYEAEKPLFRAGAKCLLQGDGTANVVNALSYDKSTDLLHVFQQGDTIAENSFRGLEVVESRGRKSNGWSYSSAALGTAAGGVTASARTSGTGGVVVDLPAIDVRGDLNTADSKLPDDGKFHFSGVTTNATQTVIANIPMEELETMSVEAIVTGHNYQAASTNRVFTHIRETFNRNLGGNIQEPGDHYKLENLGTASCDVTLTANTTSNTVQIKVTGVAGTRMQWNATVEVQRISEKTYER
jgi:hypothetical protein